MNSNKHNDKPFHLTPEEGKQLCEEAKASVEYGLISFPEIDEANKLRENSRFHKWVKERNEKDTR